jgi:N-acetylmuramoyl-L-alanine amidase CwlA
VSLNIEQKLLTPNKYSRPGEFLKSVKAVVLHWYANPLSSALANRNYFENRKYGKTNFGSAHYLVGLEGEIIQAIPDVEMAYHVGSSTYTKEALSRLSTYPNNCTLGIEMAHIDWDGRFNEKTYNSTVKLTAQLLHKYKLNKNDIWTHHGIVGWKNCPKWYVDHPSDFEKFKSDVDVELKNLIKKEVGDIVSRTFSKYFDDVDKDWMASAIDSCYEKGIIKGRSDKVYDPHSPITRGETAIVVERLINYIMKEVK